MKTNLIMVGKTNQTWLANGIDEYVKRTRWFIPFETIVIQDVKKGKSMPGASGKKEEGIQILKNISSGDIMILLDEKGSVYTSREFAGFVQRLMNGSRDIFFVIGGAYGFSDEVYKRCDFKLSLSNMTFSHQVVRLLFVEQLYRAQTIIRNQPYHHD